MIFENLNNLILLQEHLKALRLQDKLRKQNFHEDMKKVFEPMTVIVRDVFKDITRTITETSKENKKTLEVLNNKPLEIMNDKDILAPYLLSLLSKIANPEHTSQFKLVKDPD